MHNQESSDNVVAKTFGKMRDDQGQEHSVKLSYDKFPVPCCGVDVSAIINDCNVLLADLLGCPKAKLVRTSFLDVVDRSSYPVMEKLLAFHVGDNISSSTFPNIGPEIVWLRRKDSKSTIFPAALSVKPINDNHGIITGYIIVIIDETLNRRRIELLEKDRYELKKKEKLQDEFIAVASHELRTPIQPILGFAFLARKGLLSEEKAWDGVLEEARKLQHLANDILDVSRIESGSLAYDLKNEKINHLLVSITELAKNELQKEDVSIGFVYDEAEADLEIDADRARITQLITNIVGNAVKFTDKGSIRIESKSFPDQNKFEIRISDTGKGISEEIMPRLFEKFVTKGHGNIQNNKGTGLGLYISKAIVKAHGGEISAFNNKNGGATFLIVLPISQNQKGESSN
ncbi:MAG: signal transduction histidine kinase [Candidatus Nitrosomirales archaeon]|jgi:signal transduction histidine kinase